MGNSSAGKIIQDVYREIGLHEPRVASYPSFDDLVDDYENWKDAASPLSACFWSYQYPVLYPYGYWAKFRLFDEGFQFDLTRTANENGCYDIPEYKSKIDIKPSLLHNRYLAVCMDAGLKNRNSDFDEKVIGLVRDNGKFFEKMQDRLEREDPSNQMSVRDYLFLGGFSWLRMERDILRHMRRWVGKPVCEEHFQNANRICNEKILFITFTKTVFWVKLFD